MTRPKVRTGPAPSVRDALERSADPLAARSSLARLVDAHPWLGQALAGDEVLLDAIVAVTSASRSLFAALERDPVAVTMLGANALEAPMSVDAYVCEARELLRGEDPARRVDD